VRVRVRGYGIDSLEGSFGTHGVIVDSQARLAGGHARAPPTSREVVDGVSGSECTDFGAYSGSV
jgi:hypothetical protein